MWLTEDTLRPVEPRPYAVGNATIFGPNPATLTISETDGSLIIPAGVAADLGESGPVNGVIDPGETVTLLFGLRNANGTNTASLVATLQATNGVSSPERTTELWRAGRPQTPRPPVRSRIHRVGHQLDRTSRRSCNCTMAARS